MFQNSFYPVFFGVIAMMGAMVGCSSSDEFTPPEVVSYGKIEKEKPASFSGTMVENASRFHEDYPYGIDFEYKLALADTTTLMITEKHGYSCDHGVALLGPSYFLFKDGKQVGAYDYMQRNVYPIYPLLGVPQFPGTIDAGDYKLRVRFMANGDCSPSGDVTVKDRYAPQNNQPMVLHAGLLGQWSREADGVTTALTLTAAGNAVQTVSAGETEVMRTEFSAFNYPQDDSVMRLVLEVKRVTTVDEAPVESMPVAGDVFYCIYDLAYVQGKSEFTYECSPPNKTYFPTRLTAAAEKLRS